MTEHTIRWSSIGHSFCFSNMEKQSGCCQSIVKFSNNTEISFQNHDFFLIVAQFNVLKKALRYMGVI